ncbi:hypothetical protein ACT8ZV_14375 [Nocardioides sp. MAHUQ-72]|uniref:hypothetical protein n=1 Tax=unclassified Nocardioides TaxID=2615069 RepID=UPI003624183E
MTADQPFQTPPTGPARNGHPTHTATDTTTSEHAKATAGTAADEGKHVAGVARDEAQRVASEARSQVTQLMSEATTQVEEQSRTQRDRLVDTLRTFSEDLDQMASQRDGGLAVDLAREGAAHARSLSSQLDGREPRDLLDDVRGFARRKPGTFLLGALVAGVVAGRLTRGAKDAASSSPSVATTGTPVPAPRPAQDLGVPIDPPFPTPVTTPGDPNLSPSPTSGGLS